ncbi:MAG: hypothetical protein A3J76_05110 [Candidatus Moranbacteria bacterium RBG_13_45_13]|nr:MAG: hypothetical protein A3J76_05110 [Candidatus Moranbacteria bacterium RBG_13_45_13]
MSQLSNAAENLITRLSENMKTIRSQSERIEYWMKDFKSMVDQMEKIEADNVQLRKKIEEMERQHAKEMADLARQQK